MKKKLLFQMLKYRELYPNATESEYLYKKEPKNEKVVRCIKLKNSVETEHENKTAVEGSNKKINITIHIHLIKHNFFFHLKDVSLNKIVHLNARFLDGLKNMVI